MKSKTYKEKYSKKVNKKKTAKKAIDTRWLAVITISAFLISISFSFLSELIVSNVTIVIAILMLFLVVLFGVIFDMIGISVTVADLNTFNSMAAKGVKGASTAVKYIKNADKVSSFCNDVIGDICGIISGALTSSISLVLSSRFSLNILLTTLLITGIVASITIGGKAYGKSVAMNKSNIILYHFSRIMSLIKIKK